MPADAPKPEDADVPQFDAGAGEEDRKSRNPIRLSRIQRRLSEIDDLADEKAKKVAMRKLVKSVVSAIALGSGRAGQAATLILPLLDTKQKSLSAPPVEA